ncbi:MAG TPA: hypothetical protein VGX24_11330 [Pyrinomonadaceae bacterium]|jgi:hypothetical protein|nr:hypothetical protein [Pyrinomonadaceae bacterium]
MMRRLQLLLAFILLATCASHAQTVAAKPDGDTEAMQKRNALRFDLQALEAEALKLLPPLAQARARVEIADAAWTIDREWAKKLLREAYVLTFPEEKERERLRSQPIGARLTPPTGLDWPRTEIRDRVFAVAGREKAFADELTSLGARELGRMEEVERYRSLALQSLRAGDIETAGKYTSLSIKAEPTVMTLVEIIPNLAKQDRAAADKLLMEYIEELRVTPLSMTTGSATRVHVFLFPLIADRLGYTYQGQPTPPPNPALVKAYVSYVVESMTQLARTEPESLKTLRTYLMFAWLPLKQYAPELTGAFMELEKLSRRPGDDGSLPRPGSDAETRRAWDEAAIKDAIKRGQPDDDVIGRALGRRDFASLRKLIELLPDGEKKSSLTDRVNTDEALSLAAKGEEASAEKLAQLLRKAESMLRVYPVLIGACVKRKDAAGANALAHQAIKQLKATSPDSPALALSLSALAQAVAPVNVELAFDALDEAVVAANANNSKDAELGRPGINPEIFKMLGVKNEVRALQSANALKERLPRIAALAAMCRARAEAFGKESRS